MNNSLKRTELKVLQNKSLLISILGQSHKRRSNLVKVKE